MKKLSASVYLLRELPQRQLASRRSGPSPARRSRPRRRTVVLAAVDLHLVLVEAVPQVARDRRSSGVLKPVGSSIANGSFGRCAVMRLGDRRRHALGRQAAPHRRQLLEHRAVAIALRRAVRRSRSAGRWRRETSRRDCRSCGFPRRSRRRSRSGRFPLPLPARVRRANPRPNRRSNDRQSDRALHAPAPQPCLNEPLARFHCRFVTAVSGKSRIDPIPWPCPCSGVRDLLLLALALLLGAAAVRAQGALAGLSRPEAYARSRRAGRAGPQLFFDPSLSASGKMACASCHDPAACVRRRPTRCRCSSAGPTCASRACAPCPRSRYLQAVPPFTEHFYDSEDEGDESVDNGPTGGLTWDGRVDRGRDQAAFPCCRRSRWPTARRPSVVARVRGRPMPANCAALFGDGDVRPIRTRPSPPSARRSRSSSRTTADFYPYTSKYDAYLAGKAALTAQEARGLAAVRGSGQGQLRRCHCQRARPRTARRRNSPTTA